MQEKINQLNEKLAADKGLVEKIFNLETAEEVQSFLKEQGLEFTLEEISTFRDDLIKAVETGNGELSEEDLKDIAGGSALAATAATVSIVSGVDSLTGNNLRNTIVSSSRRRW